MIVLPLFHMNALFYSVAGTLAAGCSMVIVPRFSASTFWQTAVEHGRDRGQHHRGDRHDPRERARAREFRPEHTHPHGLRRARRASSTTFRDEFSIPHLIGGYGMTEIPGVTCNPFEGRASRAAWGRSAAIPIPTRPWAQCRVVDDDGRDVRRGRGGRARS